VSLYSSLARPALFALDPEDAHDLTMTALQVPGATSFLRLTHRRITDPRLTQTVCRLTFPNPVGLGAGLDKQARALAAWDAIGFGFAEIGTVTPRPQPGNPRPRLFRLPADKAVINRFGFNSEGAAAVAAHLTGAARGAVRLGINVGKNKETPNEQAADDYVAAVDRLHPYADYFVVNVSSPNTSGLRSLQDENSLRPLLERVVAHVQRVAAAIPVTVKVSPDMTEHDLLATVDAAVSGGAAGIIATNTTTSRAGLTTVGAVTAEAGGLSGAPLRRAAHDACTTIFRHFRGRVPIIGVGGIFDADAAYARIRAGASLVQIYTAFIYEGPGLVSRLNAGLLERLERDGLSSIADAVGIDVT